jgi:F-type H+-transporting ATPase subunit delta
MLRLELEKRHAIVETAVALSDSERESVLSDLKGRLGADITADFRDVPDLLGGMRVKLGSTVWDSSIKARLDGLSRTIQS